MFKSPHKLFKANCTPRFISDTVTRIKESVRWKKSVLMWENSLHLHDISVLLAESEFKRWELENREGCQLRKNHCLITLCLPHQVKRNKGNYVVKEL